MKDLRQDESEELRRYLLGQLSEERRELIERQLLTQPDLHEELEAVENELIDEYLSGKLSEQERRRFETWFPSTPERHDKIKFSQSFKEFVKSQSTSNPQEQGESSLGVLPAPSSTVRVITGLLFLILVLVGVVAWLLNVRQIDKAPEVQPLIITVAPRATKPVGTHVTQLSRPQPNLTVQVRIEINTSDYPKYQIELVRATESLMKSEPLHASKTSEGYVVDLPIDSNLLEVGDYGLRLSGIPDSGEPEFKEQYHFQVIE